MREPSHCDRWFLFFIFFFSILPGCPEPARKGKYETYQDLKNQNGDAALTQNWPKVIEVSKKQIGVFPNRCYPYLHLFEALCKMGKEEEGLDMLSRAISLGAPASEIQPYCQKPVSRSRFQALFRQAQQNEAALEKAESEPALPELWSRSISSGINEARMEFRAEAARILGLNSNRGLAQKLWFEAVNRQIGRLLFLCQRSGQRKDWLPACEEAVATAESFVHILTSGRHSPWASTKGIAQARELVLAQIPGTIFGSEAPLKITWARMVTAMEKDRRNEARGLQLSLAERFPDSPLSRLALLELAQDCPSLKQGEAGEDSAGCRLVRQNAVLQLLGKPGSYETVAKWYREALYQLGPSDFWVFRGRHFSVALLGQDASWIEGPSISGSLVSLKQFRGQKVLLEFWASWCGPCMEGVKTLRRLEGRLKGRVALVGINLDNWKSGGGWDPSRFKGLFELHRITWPQILQEKGMDGEIASRLEMDNVPLVLFVGEDLSIRAASTALAEKALLAFAGLPADEPPATSPH